MAINWEEAPEGTTHGTDNRDAARFYGTWRKRDGNIWYYYKGGEWVERSKTGDNYLRHNPHLVERPAPVEAELPDGLKWPEGFTHFNRLCGRFFFNDEGYKTVEGLGGRLMAWSNGSHDYWLKDPQTIARYPAVVKMGAKPVEKAKPKVGWWE